MCSKAFLGAMLALSLSQTAFATTTHTQTLGDQDFTNGQSIQTNIQTTWTAASIGEPSPFNGTLCGNDLPASTTNCVTSWTFNNYGAILVTDVIMNAQLTFGIFDLDGHNASDQIALFSVAGIDLTSQLNALVNASDPSCGCPSAGNGNNVWSNFEQVFTINLPSSTFAQLRNGTAVIDLSTQNGWGVLGASAYNGVYLDFSTLNVDVAPEPSSIFGMAMGLAGMAGLAYRRRARK